MKWFVAIAVDIVLVVVFCAIGRRSHDEAVLTGLLHTVWPFAAGLAVGWVVAVAIARRAAGAEPFDGSRFWPTGVVIWLCTLVFGMLLRVVAGQGTAFSFIVVATSVLALFLLGWRGVVRAIR
ncbi:DUF3054 domain-containing protein [Nocardia jinanensis]|uniref:DUF3054 domain-containing protein n=1 Tax=Nocardia jinanensis TaxID=382504 RepID=A0A917RVQ7_9NOCA|nr:DUF3054 domain-containing protein [Nocardia jinanensis]GGL38778.1 hypothetical protein GCM10011588_61720 [Nocardia jinanensis]